MSGCTDTSVCNISVADSAVFSNVITTSSFSTCFARHSPFHPLCIVNLYKPSDSFDLSALQYLIETATDLRDLKVEFAAGLDGAICGPNPLASPPPDQGLSSPIPQANITPLSNASSTNTAFSSEHRSTLGNGAMDENLDGRYEHLGLRGIQRTLHDFANNATYRQEYGFPPTLSSYQRKLVHEVAERLDLDHESIRLKNGIKIVRVKRKRRLRTQSAPALHENGTAAVGSLGTQLERHQISANLGDITGTSRMGNVWAPAPPEVLSGEITESTVFGEHQGRRRDSSVNFNFEEVEEFSDKEADGRFDEDGTDDVFKLDEEVNLPNSPPHPTSRRGESLRVAKRGN